MTSKYTASDTATSSYCGQCQNGGACTACTVCNGCLNNGPGTSYDANEDCSFLNWYFNYGPAAIQIQDQTVQPTSSVQCINPVYSLINYTVTIDAGINNKGTIDFYQTTITNAFNGDRVWNFTISGSITTPKLEITYQFDPNCFVPNGVDQLLLSQINFNSTITGDPNPLTGNLVINNFILGLSGLQSGSGETQGSYYPVSYSWNPSTATFLLDFNIAGGVVWDGRPNAPGQPVGTCTFKPGKTNSFYAALTILDGPGDVPPKDLPG